MSGKRQDAGSARWVRRAVLGALALVFLVRELLYFIFCVVATGYVVWRVPGLQAWLTTGAMWLEMQRVPPPPPRSVSSTEPAAKLVTNAQGLRYAGDLFVSTNVWDVHLRFTESEWLMLTPEKIPPVPTIFRPDGTVVLSNPYAKRNGLVGALGFHLPWSTCDMVFGDTVFSNVAVRFKGNGTFVSSQRTYKRPFKIDLARGGTGVRLAGRSVLNFHNLIADGSYLSDALGYEFCREAGLPAPRTTFARLRLTLCGRFENGLLGLYAIVENPDAEWAGECFGIDGVALFKPVTSELFKYLGDDWTAYERIYDPRTWLEDWQRRRIIDLAKLVTFADDETFSRQIGEFLDLAELARFLACQVLLANYDSVLSTGQNFILYLDPYGGRFGFVPWDLDHSWGEFPLVGTFEQRARASIWRPWVGENRFLERLFGVQAFQRRYRAELEHLRRTVFVPHKLEQRLECFAAVVRPFVAEESPDKLVRFEKIVAGFNPDSKPPGEPIASQATHFAYKWFFAMRAESVDAQLAGREPGIVLQRGGRR
ncbi:MAG: CotH kinase family protein [Verrucomicrobiae bacterium]|nr:CotH kinase family protein [Verrucomicrobiae bacterium]